MVVGGRELIDTLWNVNYIGGDYYKLVNKGINRYIMECKFRSRRCYFRSDYRINRYIMECKLHI